MKKLSFIVMACLMVLGLAQCKKNEPTNNNTADNGNRVNITLKLDNGGQKVHPEEENGLANVVYDNGDVVYVGSDGKYVGCLTYNGTLFTGSINAEATEGQPLQFIFMGGQTIEGLTENSSTECIFNIGDQSNGLAVISGAASNEDFSLTNLSYTAYLRNKCALVKFDLGETSTGAAIALTGMKTEATIGFDGTVTNLSTTGNITTYGTGSTRYAVVLSDQEAVTEGTVSAEGYTGTFSIPTAAYTNAFLTDATMTLTAAPIGPLATPLTLEALTGGDIVVNIVAPFGKGGGVYPGSSKGGPSNVSVKYSLNGGEKTPVTSDAIAVSAGDKVQFYGNGPDLINYYVPNIAGGTAQVKVYGNIMSMLDEDNYATLTTLQPAAFYALFGGNANLTDASGLLLPAATLTEVCYFGMFTGCTSLTTAPALPATELAAGCYAEMFSGCTNLNNITCLATEGIDENYSTNNWVDGVASTGTFNRASGATWPEGVNGIPSGWTLVPPATPAHEYVDLGLPSGLLWATCNIGANAPEEYGDYFAWGETTTKTTYDWSTYQYCNGSSNTLTKYCNDASYGNNGFTDNLTTLQPEDDAATANWGSDWRMPTKEEFEELYNNTTATWTQQGGVNGWLFTANNNSLFLPAAGNYGNYWSSSLITALPHGAWSFGFDSMYYDVSGSSRNEGQSVRPVREN